MTSFKVLSSILIKRLTDWKDNQAICVIHEFPLGSPPRGFLFLPVQRMRMGHIVWQVIHRPSIRSAQKIVWQLPEHIRNPGTGEFHLTFF